MKIRKFIFWFVLIYIVIEITKEKQMWNVYNFTKTIPTFIVDLFAR